MQGEEFVLHATKCPSTFLAAEKAKIGENNNNNKGKLHFGFIKLHVI
jgi:hypothetical protein